MRPLLHGTHPDPLYPGQIRAPPRTMVAKFMPLVKESVHVKTSRKKKPDAVKMAILVSFSHSRVVSGKGAND